MPDFVINGPDGRSFRMNIDPNSNPDDVVNKISWIKSNWNILGKEGSTAPESNPGVKQGPLRPSFLDMDLQPKEEVRGENFLSPEQKETARAAEEIMFPEQAALTRHAIAEDEAKLQRKLSPTSPIGYGATGSISSGLTDKFSAALNAAAYKLSPRMGQPYEEGLETQKILRQKNFEENPVQTFLGGAATAISLPTINKFNPNTARGWIGNAAATGSLYGAIQGAGEGDSWQDALLNALTGAGIGTTVGAALGKTTSKLRPQSEAEVQAIKDANLAKVRINQAIASDDPSIQQAAGLISETPFVGTTVKKGLQTAKEDVESGINRIAQGYREQGAAPGRFAPIDTNSDVPIGEFAINRIKNKIKNLDPQEMDREFTKLSSEIPSSASSSMDATRRIAQTLTDEDVQAASSVNSPAINSVMEAVTRPEGMSYEGLLSLKTNVGALLKSDIVNQAGTSAPAFKRLYGAISQDIKDLVQTNGSPSALSKYNKMMADAQKAILRRKALVQIIGKEGQIKPEALVDDVYRWASQGPGRDFKKLMVLKNAIGEDGMNDLAAVALQKSMISKTKKEEKSIGNFQKFWSNLTSRGKDMLFKQNPDLVKELDALHATAKNIDRVLQNVNSSKTAYGNFLIYLLDKGARLAEKITTGIGVMITGGAALADLGTTAMLTGASAGVPVALGKLYANGLSKPATIKALNRTYQAIAKYVQAPQGSPTTIAINQLRYALVNLANEAAKESGEDPRKVANEILEAAKLPPS